MEREIIVLIPAYEPNMVLIDLLKKLEKSKVRVVVVDDGSGVEYKHIFDKASRYAHVISYEINKGKGGALKTGFRYIMKNISGNYVVVTMDSDGQHSVSDTLKIGEYAMKNLDQLVLGKRLRGNKTPFKSMIGNTLTRFIFRVITGVDVYDTQTGLRAFSSRLIPLMLEIDGDRFEYEMNVLIYFALWKIAIKEVGIETIYIDNNSHSHFDPVKDSILVYKEIFKFMGSSFLCFLIDYLLYILILVFSSNLVIANVLARVISAGINFNINRRLVFNNKGRGYRQVFLYFLLAVIILIINSVMLSFMVNTLMINKYFAKIIIEILLMFFSFVVQKRIIFD